MEGKSEASSQRREYTLAKNKERKKNKQKINKDINNQITIDYWQGKSQATKKVKISKQR